MSKLEELKKDLKAETVNSGRIPHKIPEKYAFVKIFRELLPSSYLGANSVRVVLINLHHGK